MALMVASAAGGYYVGNFDSSTGKSPPQHRKVSAAGAGGDL
jgi:hypothetical protein